MKKRIIALLTCVMLIAALCIVPDVDAGTTTLTLTTQSQTIEVGQSFKLKVAGIKASKIKWKSSNTDVATVSKSGIVNGIKSGKATITGKYKKIKFTIKVKVKEKTENVVIYDNKYAKVTYIGISNKKMKFKIENKNDFVVESWLSSITCDGKYLGRSYGSDDENYIDAHDSIISTVKIKDGVIPKEFKCDFYMDAIDSGNNFEIEKKVDNHISYTFK